MTSSERDQTYTVGSNCRSGVEKRLVSTFARDQTHPVGPNGRSDVEERLVSTIARDHSQTYPVGSHGRVERVRLRRYGSETVGRSIGSSSEGLVSIGRPGSSMFHERVMREGGNRVGNLYEPTIKNSNKLTDNRNQ